MPMAEGYKAGRLVLGRLVTSLIARGPPVVTKLMAYLPEYNGSGYTQHTHTDTHTHTHIYFKDIVNCFARKREAVRDWVAN